MTQQVPNAAAPAAAGLGESFGDTDAIFQNTFDLYGLLDHEGRVVRLGCRIFERRSVFDLHR